MSKTSLSVATIGINWELCRSLLDISQFPLIVSTTKWSYVISQWIKENKSKFHCHTQNKKIKNQLKIIHIQVKDTWSLLEYRHSETEEEVLYNPAYIAEVSDYVQAEKS